MHQVLHIDLVKLFTVYVFNVFIMCYYVGTAPVYSIRICVYSIIGLECITGTLQVYVLVFDPSGRT